jgi:hypothetical protein
MCILEASEIWHDGKRDAKMTVLVVFADDILCLS